MRAFLSLIILLVCLSLVACGGGSSNQASNSGNPSGSNTGGSNSGGSNTGGGSGNGTGGSVAADAIGGRVLDAASQAVPLGTVVVTLESQQGNASIVNATTPDAQGNFTFTQVSAGSYAIVVSAAVDRNTSYSPVLLVSGTKQITPGTYVGTISVPHPTTGGWASVNVPVQSDKPITVTLSANVSINNNQYPVPWALDIPTFDTAVQTGCPNSGGACTVNTIQLPGNPVLVGNFNGTATQYQAAGSTTYSLVANAYTQNGGTPNCNPTVLGPASVSVSTSQTTQVAPFVFNNCQ